METPSARAQILADALPQLRALSGSLVVIKYGGSVIDEPIYADSILTDVAFLRQAGISVVIVHGGGKAISSKMREAGIVPKFVDGIRITDMKTVRIVDSVLSRIISLQIVKQLKERGVEATGLHGRKVLTAKKLIHTTATGQKVSLGFVGDVSNVSKNRIQSFLRKGIVPVISPLAAGPGSSVLNVNADTAASRIAGALKAANLIFLSDVNGLLEDAQHPDSTIAKVSPNDIQGLQHTGVIHSGMLPKVQSAMDALKKGVRRVKLLNGQIAHCILVDLFIDRKIGTEVVLST